MIGGLEEWKSLGGLEDGKDCNIGRPCLAMFWGSERDGKSTKLARNRLRGATIEKVTGKVGPREGAEHENWSQEAPQSIRESSNHRQGT